MLCTHTRHAHPYSSEKNAYKQRRGAQLQPSTHAVYIMKRILQTSLQ